MKRKRYNIKCKGYSLDEVLRYDRLRKEFNKKIKEAELKGREEREQEILKLINKLVNQASGDISYGELKEHIKNEK